ncbi:glucuronate isomerase [Paenibacillus sambharensis]|uniref:Uronate isomerase n=1 Tax=Paenibacillus sambharensis TaxID=1803190 RepID=A0A2W1L4G2_9BACL|nr:glucuronate isomerase [Paenibacillus sambharensis]PZD93779.1 glucuronate isomerase [Paenibacillus sambharensis]
MKPFLDEDFLLSNNTAVTLFHDYAKQMPIIDYHCHLSPQEIYENKSFKNLTEVWLYGDHYKWRAMRTNGIEETLVTGGQDASDYDRYMAWAKTVPQTLGNPLYHWSHLELQRFFGVHELINEKNADSIWEAVNGKLEAGGYAARDLITKSNVEVICTTDDPTDSLEHHIKIKDIPGFHTKILPSFRPDKALELRRPTFLPWIGKLEEASGSSITNYAQLLGALESRIAFFHTAGCRVSDHALDTVPYAEASETEVAAIFTKALNGGAVSLEEEQKYKTYTLLFLGRQYAERGWAMQYHMHASRNNNTRMFETLGPDTGYDSIHDGSLAYPLAKLLDALDRDNALPKTILYSLNPTDNDVLAAVIGSFQGGGVAGKIQFGSAWWFNDTKDGMLDQLRALSNMGLLSRFIGMLTDSRSFLSYPRHEYFRRIVCNLLGQWVENGEVPHDMELLGGMVQNISYHNAKRYFDF